ncbi:hypothetical protein PIB30_033723 [Stylosanthes scabra]|uniref:Uncharacterized protein n=1 Tax=Stylosanthes scabra TaxID=79078 RepID=A0ABU6ZBX8_9FABA|nr:hypothetical protein [Stylosanthes scabra]
MVWGILGKGLAEETREPSKPTSRVWALFWTSPKPRIWQPNDAEVQYFYSGPAPIHSSGKGTLGPSNPSLRSIALGAQSRTD